MSRVFKAFEEAAIPRPPLKLMLGLFVLCVMVGMVAAVGCAPKQAGGGGTPAASGGDGDSVAVAWSMADDCTTCHTAESSAQDATAPAVVHAEQGTTCITCHSEEAKLTTAHEKATADAAMPTKLKRTKVEASLCASCHSITELATLTEASTAITDTEGTVVNPHSIPESSSHSTITCVSCHEVHKPAAAVAQSSLNACYNCHHEKVLACNTCHD